MDVSLNLSNECEVIANDGEWIISCCQAAASQHLLSARHSVAPHTLTTSSCLDSILPLFSDWGVGPTFGNHASDHCMHLPNSDGSAKIVQRAEIGPLAVGPKFVVTTNCHAVQDESGKSFTPLDARAARPPPSFDPGAGLSLETCHARHDLEVQLASSNLIPTAAAHKHLTNDDFDAFDPLAAEKMTN
jgi:hypothetical protein